jgi:hypothetical protein
MMDIVVHTSNFSYSGGRDREDYCSRAVGKIRDYPTANFSKKIRGHGESGRVLA